MCGTGPNAGGVYSFSKNPSSLAGNGNQKSTGASVSAYNFNQYLAALYSSNLQSGVSNTKYSSNPNVSGGANGVIGALTQASTASQLSAAASIGAQARTTASNAGDTAANSPASITKQYTNGASSSAYGALPPAP